MGKSAWTQPGRSHRRGNVGGGLENQEHRESRAPPRKTGGRGLLSNSAQGALGMDRLVVAVGIPLLTWTETVTVEWPVPNCFERV